MQGAAEGSRLGLDSPCTNLAGLAQPDWSPDGPCTCVYTCIVDWAPVAVLAKISSIQRCSDLFCLAVSLRRHIPWNVAPTCAFIPLAII